MPYWTAVARMLLDDAKKWIKGNIPKAEIVLIKWRDSYYFGTVQVIFPGFDTEIVLVSKTGKTIEEGLSQAIKELEPGIILLTALDQLDLEGNYHVVRKSGSEILEMTPEQTQYAAQNMPAIQDQLGRANVGVLIDYNHPVSNTHGCC